MVISDVLFFFFFNDTATTEIYTLSLHDALPICSGGRQAAGGARHGCGGSECRLLSVPAGAVRRRVSNRSGGGGGHEMDGYSNGYRRARGGELMRAEILPDVFAEGLHRHPDGVAVREPGTEITYRKLNHLTNRLARALLQRGVAPGDRVAIWLPKSINAVAAMQAVLRVGAAYVPVDPLSPT